MDVRGNAGVRNGESVHTRAGAVGHVVYGPHTFLMEGNYDATFKIRGPRNRSFLRRHEKVAAVEVVSGEEILAHRYLTRRDLRRSEHSLNFSLLSGGDFDVEARVWTGGQTQFAVDAVDVEQKHCFSRAPGNHADEVIEPGLDQRE